jgi:hypothetical protein
MTLNFLIYEENFLFFFYQCAMLVPGSKGTIAPAPGKHPFHLSWAFFSLCSNVYLYLWLGEGKGGIKPILTAAKSLVFFVLYLCWMITPLPLKRMNL